MAVTVLGPGGYPRPPYASFLGRAPFVPPPVVVDSVDTHDGGSEDYVRHWKRLKQKEDDKRRKREAEARAPKPQPEPVAVAEQLEPLAPRPVKKAAPTIDHPRALAEIERIKQAADQAAREIAAARRRKDEQTVLKLLELEDRALLQLLHEAIKELQ